MTACRRFVKPLTAINPYNRLTSAGAEPIPTAAAGPQKKESLQRLSFITQNFFLQGNPLQGEQTEELQQRARPGNGRQDQHQRHGEPDGRALVPGHVAGGLFGKGSPDVGNDDR